MTITLNKGTGGYVCNGLHFDSFADAERYGLLRQINTLTLQRHDLVETLGRLVERVALGVDVEPVLEYARNLAATVRKTIPQT